MGNVSKHKQRPSDFLLGSERAEKLAYSLFGALLTFWNRRMRTRMYGGVRGRRLGASSYSIYVLAIARLRPARFASYNASSARLNTSSNVVPCSGQYATPIDTVIGLPIGPAVFSTLRRIRSARLAPICCRCSATATTNSLPPNLQIRSPSLHCDFRMLAR